MTWPAFPSAYGGSDAPQHVGAAALDMGGYVWLHAAPTPTDFFFFTSSGFLYHSLIHFQALFWDSPGNVAACHAHSVRMGVAV